MESPQIWRCLLGNDSSIKGVQPTSRSICFDKSPQPTTHNTSDTLSPPLATIFSPVCIVFTMFKAAVLILAVLFALASSRSLVPNSAEPTETSTNGYKSEISYDILPEGVKLGDALVASSCYDICGAHSSSPGDYAACLRNCPGLSKSSKKTVGKDSKK